MKAANSKAVYKKLIKTYGNSFQSILEQHSLKAPQEELYTMGSIVKDKNGLSFTEPKGNAGMVVEASILAGALLRAENTNDDGTKESIVFFSEDYLEAEDYPYSSHKVQKKIETLAEKITRGIIDSKGI